MGNKIKILLEGMFTGNPVFVLLLGLCPTLGTTTSAINGFSMGVAVIAVLACSNVLISLFKKCIPDQVRIPAFIMIIASLVTIVDMMMNAYTPELYKVLGLFIPLIVVNCIVLGRAESFASKNSVFDSLLDGIGTGIGFTLSLTLLGTIREILGNGTWFGFPILGKNYVSIGVITQAPGAFIILGLLVAGFNMLNKKVNAKKEGGN